ncbi:hypothetical protein RI054_34g132760 [Pseudoscourfieldia marina]
MADAPNELEVLEARREILQLEIALAQERRAAAEAEQKGKKAADEGGEPTLDFVVPAIYPDARHAESLPTTGILRRGKPTLLSLPSNPVLQHLEAESVKQGHASSHNAWIFRSIVSVSAYLELGVLSLQQETDDRLEDLATYVEGELDVERGDDGKPLDPDGDALVHFNELNKKIAEIDSVLERTRNTLTGVLELAAELEDFFVANKGPRTVITKETADATVAQLLEETTAYPPRSKRTTRIQKEIRSNRATQIAKQAAVKSVASNKKDKP